MFASTKMLLIIGDVEAVIFFRKRKHFDKISRKRIIIHFCLSTYIHFCLTTAAYPLLFALYLLASFFSDFGSALNNTVCCSPFETFRST